MKIKDAVINFLYDQNYFITIYDNKIHIYKYNKLLKLSNAEIILEIDRFIIKIKGEKLVISKMNEEELLIEGIIKSISKHYE